MFQPDPKKEPRPKKLPKPLPKFSKKRLQQIARNELPVKIKKPISRLSDKEKIRLSKYYKLRDEYLKEHPNCEVKNCPHLATSIHHMAGRINENLFKHFLAVCYPCHERIENNPIWAKENGYSMDRLNKEI